MKKILMTLLIFMVASFSIKTQAQGHVVDGNKGKVNRTDEKNSTIEAAKVQAIGTEGSEAVNADIVLVKSVQFGFDQSKFEKFLLFDKVASEPKATHIDLLSNPDGLAPPFGIRRPVDMDTKLQFADYLKLNPVDAGMFPIKAEGNLKRKKSGEGEKEEEWHWAAKIGRCKFVVEILNEDRTKNKYEVLSQPKSGKFIIGGGGYKTDVKVSIVGPEGAENCDCWKDWETGLIQNITETKHDFLTFDPQKPQDTVKLFLRCFSGKNQLKRVLDGMAKDADIPFYSTSDSVNGYKTTRTSFTACNVPVTLSFEDFPSGFYGLVNKSPKKDDNRDLLLEEVKREANFNLWVVARHKQTKELVFLKNFTWSIKYTGTVKWDKKTFRIPTDGFNLTNDSKATYGAWSDGMGAVAPIIDKPQYNDCVKLILE